MLLCLLALLACSDDDDDADVVMDAGTQPTMRDAGAAPMGKPDAHIAAAVDAARPVDPKDGAVDARDGASEVCKRENVPHWGPPIWSATRIPLAVYCDNTWCPPSLAEYASTLQCTDDVDAGQDGDAGPCADSRGWLRRAGCGKVQFDARLCDWPRDIVFDAETGELIGGARLDDVFTPLRGTTCNDAAYIAGELLDVCPGETRSLCMPKR